MILPYYPRYPKDFFDGTFGMPLEVKGAYSILIDLIMMRGDMGLPDDAKAISGHLGCSVRKWNSIRKTLIDLGKLTAENGMISNSRADKEKIKQRSYRDKKAENASGSRENKDLAERQPTSEKITDYKEDIPEANASGRDASPTPSADEDFSKQVFDRAVMFLGRHGVKEPQARSFVGKLRKGGAADAEIFAAFAACSKAGAVDPVSWITATLRTKPPPDRAINDNVLRLVAEQQEADERRRSAR